MYPEDLPEEVVVVFLVDDPLPFLVPLFLRCLLFLDPLEILDKNLKRRFFWVTMRSIRMVKTTIVETSIPTTMPANTEMITKHINIIDIIKYANSLEITYCDFPILPLCCTQILGRRIQLDLTFHCCLEPSRSCAGQLCKGRNRSTF